MRRDLPLRLRCAGRPRRGLMAEAGDGYQVAGPLSRCRPAGHAPNRWARDTAYWRGKNKLEE